MRRAASDREIILLTGYEARWQKVLISVVLVYTAFSSWYGGDLWFFLAALIGLGAKDVDWETALRVYLVTAVAGLVLVQALHFATPLMPYKFYCRNWDFGYGHYNGFGARLVGVFFAWGWLRHDRLRAFDWAGLAALAIFTYKVPGSRGAFGGMAVLFVLFFVQRLPETVRQQNLLRAGAGAARRAGSVQSLRRVCLQPRVAL